jgi:hypothetical protein
MLVGAAILMILALVSIGVSNDGQQADDFSQRLAHYRDSTRPDSKMFDSSGQSRQQQIAENSIRATRSNARADNSVREPGTQPFDTNSVPVKLERENLPPLPPPVDRIASGLLDRLESRVDQVLESVLGQGRVVASRDSSFDFRTHDQITELRIQNQVELRDIQRRIQLITEHQDRISQSMQTQQAEFAKSLAATDDSIAKQIDKLVNAIPQRIAANYPTYPVSHPAAQNLTHDRSRQESECSDQSCPHCQQFREKTVPQPKESGNTPSEKSRSTDDLRSAERVWMKPVSTGHGLRNWGNSNRSGGPSVDVHRRSNTLPAPAPRPQPLEAAPKIEAPVESHAPDDQSQEDRPPRIATEPDATRTSYIGSQNLEIATIVESIVTSDDPIGQTPIQAEIELDEPTQNETVSTYIPLIDLPSFNEPLPAPAMQEFDQSETLPIIEVASAAEYSAAPEYLIPSEHELQPIDSVEPVLSVEKPLKIRMSVIHVMANRVQHSLPSGISSLHDFVKAHGGWSDGDHDTKAAQLEASLSTVRTAKFLTSAETGFINDEARYAIGSKCLHCVTEEGVLALDRFVIQKLKFTELGTEVSLQGLLINGDAIGGLPKTLRTVNAGEHFVVTEAAQNGFVQIHDDSKWARIPLIGKNFAKEEVRHMAVQRVILFSVTHDEKSTEQDAPSSTATTVKENQEPRRIDSKIAPQPFLRAPQLRTK